MVPQRRAREPDDGAARAATWSLGAVVRTTGLSAHTLRAWERRYGAVQPLRTPGGTRRYRDADVARLRLLRAGTEAGHPISALAPLSDAELRHRVEAATPEPDVALEPLLEAIEALRADEARRALALRLSALGPRAFARDVAAPVLRAVGDRWAAGRTTIAAEHLASALLRDLLGTALRHAEPSSPAPRLLFATPTGERHELGAWIAAVVAAAAGARVTHLGADLPVEELARSAEQLEADALVLAAVTIDAKTLARTLRALRAALPADCALWIGGAATHAGAAEGVEVLSDFDALEARIATLARSAG